MNHCIAKNILMCRNGCNKKITVHVFSIDLKKMCQLTPQKTSIVSLDQFYAVCTMTQQTKPAIKCYPTFYVLLTVLLNIIV